MEVPIILEPRKYSNSRVNLAKTSITIFSCMGYYFIMKLKDIIKKKIPI